MFKTEAPMHFSHEPSLKTLTSPGIWRKLKRLKEKQLFQARQGIFRGAVVLHHPKELQIKWKNLDQCMALHTINICSCRSFWLRMKHEIQDIFQETILHRSSSSTGKLQRCPELTT